MNVSGKNVLILGDSLSVGTSSPGGQLATILQARGANVRINAKIGRSAHSFFIAEAGGVILADEARRTPDIVLVMLGTNDLGLNLAVDAQQMARIKNAFPRASVWGIGPPALPKRPVAAANVVAMMRTVFPQFIDWRPLTPSTGRSPDLVHFRPEGAQLAAQNLAQALLATRGVPLAAKIGVGALVLAFVGVGIYALRRATS